MNKQNNKTMGTIGLENTLLQNKERLRYDEAGKNVLKRKEVLANILKYALPEFKDYSCDEIITFIDGESISDTVQISPDSDTRIYGLDTSQSSINEANLVFDIIFKVVKPTEKKIHLHVDLELQGDYYPPYPIEKRGIYNLSRMISSQLDVVTKKTNYNHLEKTYCIFICVGNVPKKDWNTVSYYEFANTRNIGTVTVNPTNYDLMGLILIRLGASVTADVTDIVRFLYGIFYDMDELEPYIDFSQNEEFRKELKSMAITGEHLIEFGREMELEKTAIAERERDEANQKLQETSQKLNETSQKLEQAFQTISSLEKSISLLEEKLNELQK